MKKTKINMRQLLAITILLLFSTSTRAQIHYSGKLESGFMIFRYNTVHVEPTPGWKGYYLSADGMDINVINGLTIAQSRIFAGLGLGYQNFAGTNGVSVFADLEYLPLKTKLTPLLNVKLGHNHIWNKYDGGTRTALIEFGFGANYKLAGRFNIYTQAGFLHTQQALLWPIRLGIRYRK